MSGSIRALPTCKLNRKRGVALIATLVFLFILNVIVVLFLNEVEDRIRYRAQTAGNDELRSIAYDYLEFTLGILKEFKQFDSPFLSARQGWGAPLDYEPFPIEHEGLNAVVRIEDAANKIPLNRLDEESFVVLLESLGIDAFTAARYRDCYFDWIDSDDDTRPQGAEAREYEMNRFMMPLTPPNKALETISEFQYIMGFADWNNPARGLSYHPELFESMNQLLTVEYDNPVNLNVASPGVLAFFKLLQRMNPEGIERYLAGKDLMIGTPDDRIIDLSGANLPSPLRMAMGEHVSSDLFSSETTRVRVVIDLERYDTYVFHLEALVNLGNSGSDQPVSGTESETAEDAGSQKQGKTNPNNGAVTPLGSSSFEILVIKENI